MIYNLYRMKVLNIYNTTITHILQMRASLRELEKN